LRQGAVGTPATVPKVTESSDLFRRRCHDGFQVDPAFLINARNAMATKSEKSVIRTPYVVSITRSMWQEHLSQRPHHSPVHTEVRLLAVRGQEDYLVYKF
jgi:hypothetical protein